MRRHFTEFLLEIFVAFDFAAENNSCFTGLLLRSHANFMQAATDADNTRDGPNPEQESTMPKAAKTNSTPRRTASLRKTSPAGAPARPIVDPIFAAIENHQRLDKEVHDLWEAQDEAEGEARTKHGWSPSRLIDWPGRNEQGLDDSGIERVKDSLRLSGVEPVTIETEYWEARTRWLGGVAAGKEWDECAGLATLRRDVDRASSAEQRAAMQMARTKPRTPAGAGALLGYTKTLMFEVGEMDWHETALETVIRSLAGRSPQAGKIISAARGTYAVVGRSRRGTDGR
jgi:hypothetical protein